MFTPVKGTSDYDVEVYDDVEHYERADTVYLKLPVMSVGNWSEYVHRVDTEFQRPPFGVWTRIYIQPDPKSQFRIHFEALEALPDELAGVIWRRHELARDATIQPYASPRA